VTQKAHLVGDGDVDAQHGVDGLVVALQRLHEAAVLDARHQDLPLRQLRLHLDARKLSLLHQAAPSDYLQFRTHRQKFSVQRVIVPHWLFEPSGS